MIEENIIQIKKGITINVNVSVKDIIYVKKIIFGYATCSFESGKYLVNIIEDSLKYDKDVKTNFNEKNITCKIQNVYLLLAFLLITIAILIVVSIYRYLIQYRAKNK